MDLNSYTVKNLESELLAKRINSRIVVDDTNENSDKRKIGTPKVSIKFLVNNNSAGYLIGKAGATIVELQGATKARINIAQSGELFPGTLERAVLITGALSHVLACQGLIWNKIAPSIQLDETSDDGLNLISGKLLVPSAASGLIIGRSGATIQLISETSGAKLQLSSKDDLLNTKERILTLTGSLPSCIKATHQIIAKLAEDDDINKYYNPTTCYDNLTKLNGEESRSGKRLKKKSSSSYERTVNLTLDQTNTDLNVVQTPFNFTETLSATTTITMAVPDAFTGIILGSGGQAISEITRFTGAKITVSKRGEFIEGTTNRQVTIVGTPQAAQAAHLFIAEKVKQAAIDQSNRNINSNSNANSNQWF